MNIAIATCEEKPNLTADDQRLAKCLENSGARVKPLIWNAPDTTNELKWDAVIVRSVWDYHRNHKEFASWIATIENSCIPMINSVDVIKWNLNKAYLLELEQKGVPIVPSLLLEQNLSTTEAIERIFASKWTEIVIKPTISASSFLTFRFLRTDLDLPKAIDQIKRHSAILVQPYIPSVGSEGELSLIFFAGPRPNYSHCVLKQPRTGDFRVQSDYGGSVIEYQPSVKTIEFADYCLKSIPGDWTFARVDIVEWNHSPLISELELIEPDLFLSIKQDASQHLADLVMEKLKLD